MILSAPDTWLLYCLHSKCSERKQFQKTVKCPLSIQGPIRGGKTSVEGKSSQFLTAILLAVPLIEGDTEISVFNLNEKPYVEITLDWLNRQNIKFEYSKRSPELQIQRRPDV